MLPASQLVVNHGIIKLYNIRTLCLYNDKPCAGD